MFCPKCGSENVKRVRTGDWRCSECATYFNVNESAWHGNTPNAKRQSSFSNESANKFDSLRKNPVTKNASFISKYPALVVAFLAFLVFSGVIIYRDYKDKKESEHYRLEKEAKEEIDDLLDNPFYMSKAEFEAQKEKLHPDIEGLELNMPFSADSISKKKFFKEVYFSEEDKMLNHFTLYNFRNKRKLFGDYFYEIKGIYESGRLLSIEVEFYDLKDNHEAVVVENIRKWAGKGCYVTYNRTFRKAEYEWQYKNATINLVFDYHHRIYLKIIHPETDLDKILEEKKAAYAKKLEEESKKFYKKNSKKSKIASTASVSNGNIKVLQGLQIVFSC